MILTDKDAKTLQHNAKFKSVELSEDFHETHAVPTAIESRPQSPSMEVRISLFEAKKLNTSHMQTMREQRLQNKQRETQLFRQEKQAINELSITEALRQEQELRGEVGKYREIKKIIKEEQVNELKKNLQVFVNLNLEEKILRTELMERQTELQLKEKQLRLAGVVHKQKIAKLKKEEREKFIGSFAQAKNLIDNQLKVGYHIKTQKKLKMDNKRKADHIKQSKKEDQLAVALRTKVYGGFQPPEQSVEDRTTAFNSIVDQGYRSV